MKVIDNRGLFSITFGELNIGVAFQNEEGDICIKTDDNSAIYWTGGQWIPCHLHENGQVLPLEVTYTFESKGGK